MNSSIVDKKAPMLTGRKRSMQSIYKPTVHITLVEIKKVPI
jgi:hypothetical protein